MIVGIVRMTVIDVKKRMTLFVLLVMMVEYASRMFTILRRFSFDSWIN